MSLPISHVIQKYVSKATKILGVSKVLMKSKSLKVVGQPMKHANLNSPGYKSTENVAASSSLFHIAHEKGSYIRWLISFQGMPIHLRSMICDIIGKGVSWVIGP